MKDITIIGSGNVAHHLIHYVQNSSALNLRQIYARSPEKIIFPEISRSLIVSDVQELVESDLYIIAVSDNSIKEVSNQLPFQDRLVVHTSGTASMDILNTKNKRGVFYPLQTFSKAKEINFRTIPLCIEAESKAVLEEITSLAVQFSDRIYEISSEQRKSIHVSAVFVNNFVNHLYALGDQICKDNQVPFDILKPLIEETAAKIQTLTPLEAQTGPAIRRDTQTIEKHLAFLDQNIPLKNLYLTLTESIQNYNV